MDVVDPNFGRFNFGRSTEVESTEVADGRHCRRRRQLMDAVDPNFGIQRKRKFLVMRNAILEDKSDGPLSTHYRCNEVCFPIMTT
jgi:hypothetical protein